MFGGQLAGSAMASSHSILQVRELGCRGVQPLIQNHMAGSGSELILGGQAKKSGFPAGLVGDWQWPHSTAYF